MLRRASSLVGRAAVRGRRVHTEAKLREMGIELPVPKAPLGKQQAHPVRTACSMFKCPSVQTLLLVCIGGQFMEFRASLAKFAGKRSSSACFELLLALAVGHAYSSSGVQLRILKLRRMFVPIRQLCHDGEDGKPPVHVGSLAD